MYEKDWTGMHMFQVVLEYGCSLQSQLTAHSIWLSIPDLPADWLWPKTWFVSVGLAINWSSFQLPKQTAAVFNLRQPCTDWI